MKRQQERGQQKKSHEIKRASDTKAVIESLGEDDQIRNKREENTETKRLKERERELGEETARCDSRSDEEKMRERKKIKNDKDRRTK